MAIKKNKVTSVDGYLGTRVRLRRLLIGMSQEKLGELLGLTFQQVQKYEKGTNRICASRLYEIAGILGVPVSYFFEDVLQSPQNGTIGMAAATFDVNAAPQILEFVSSVEGFQIMRAFARIGDTRVRKRLLDLAKLLSGEDDASLGVKVAPVETHQARQVG